MKRASLLLFLGILSGGTALSAKPAIPKDMSPKTYYDGFFPTEAWVQGLGPVPRGERQAPFQTITIIEALPDYPPARWSGATILLTSADVDRMKREMRRFLSVTPEQCLGLVPRRNRIAGNDRVMPDGSRVTCPTGDKGLLQWYPDAPNTIYCSRGHTVDPFERFPKTGAFTATGPMGDKQEYSYHDAADGKTRVFLEGEYMVPLRMNALSAAARDMGILYRLTGDVEYARRTAAIVYDFACAIRHWPKIARGYHSGLEDSQRFRPVDDYREYAGIWYDKYHSGIGGIPVTLASAYDLVADAPVWDGLNRTTQVGDARAVIEQDLFLFSAQDAIRYDIHYPGPEAVVSNYIPSQIRGLLAIGRAAGIAELVHYAYWKEQQLTRKTLMADGTFPESMSYARQHVYGLAAAAKHAEGYSDPKGFVSTVDGVRYDNLDMLRDLPELRRAMAALETMVYPAHDEYFVVHDTYGRLLGKAHPAPPQTRPLFYPAFGHAVLARGEREKSNQIQAHLHYSGNWGHDHLDMLNFILWACKDELVSDIGYAHTYRAFANNTSSHNLVVVDRRYQEHGLSLPGDLIAWHAPEDAPQVVEVSGAQAYQQCSVYRRALFLLPVGESDSLVLDIFDVSGGNVHEWMAQGSCMVDGTLEVSVPAESRAESYADDGKPFLPPGWYTEYTKQRKQQGLNPDWLGPNEKDPWYGVFRNVAKGRMRGPMTARFHYAAEGYPELRLHMLAPAAADVYTCTVPSLRRCWTQALRREDASLVEQFRMPKLIVRRDGTNLATRFAAIWEPMPGREVVASIRNLASENPDLAAFEIRTTPQSGDRILRVFYSPDPLKRLRTDEGSEFQGRYAVVTRRAGATRVALYDCVRFKDGDLEVSVAPRPPLAVEGVAQAGEERTTVRLSGAWDDVTPAQPLVYDPPEHVILSQPDGRARAFPVQAVERDATGMLLRCARHPGFEYNPKAAELREVFMPFNTVSGTATTTLPNQLLIEREGDHLHVRGTSAAQINGRGVPRGVSHLTVP